ncbi:ICMT-domain-containing protein [Pluteus cervinus]|uniref:ICMT-domain-containing protein n=1 Tax=Pluteus cervinus TaxID=181527 RepID=A0ACD3AQD1_9AGAR|nr:ICMT-domain-containing protein [Pluteus cervinus]
MTPPNPTPPRSERASTTGSESTLRWIPAAAKGFFWLAAIGETLAIVNLYVPILPATSLFPTSPSPLRLTAPLLLGWSLNLVGATIRRECYRTLGHYFTFVLSIRPNHKLVTSGPYAWVRHPSYTGAIIAGIGTNLSHFSPGSWVVECFGVWLKLKLNKPSLSLNMFDMGWLEWCCCLGVVAVVQQLILAPRMRKEDEMLRKEFGSEWEKWEQRVPYWLIPGIF